MRADGNEVGVELMDVFKRLFAEPLNRVRVKNNPRLATNPSQFID